MLRNVLNIPGWPYICHQVFWFDSGLTTAGFSISFFLIPQCLYFQLRQDVQSIFPPIYALVHAVIYMSTSKGGSVEVVGQTSEGKHHLLLLYNQMHDKRLKATLHRVIA